MSSNEFESIFYLVAAGRPFWPSHQESTDPGPVDPEPGHEGSDRCLYTGERLGGGLLKRTPLPVHNPHNNATQSLGGKRWQLRELLMWICVLCEKDYRGSHVSQASLATTFDLCCKRPAPDCGYSTFKPLPLNPPFVWILPCVCILHSKLV